MPSSLASVTTANAGTFRKAYTTVGVYLTGVHLTSVHLMGGCLIGVHLTGVYLIRIYFIGVCLMGVHLTVVHLICVYLIYESSLRAGHGWRESLYRHQRCLKASVIVGDSAVRLLVTLGARSAW